MTQDQEIQHDVLGAIGQIALARRDRVHVEVRQGVVTLSGTVNSYPQRDELIRTVRRVPGVVAVVGGVVPIARASFTYDKSEIDQSWQRR